MSGRTILPLFTFVCLAACSGTVTHRDQFAFPDGRIELVIRSVGGALGEEDYELRSLADPNRPIFRGANFSEFNVVERDGKLSIQLCRGLIDHAEPWAIGAGETLRLVRLNIDWNCRDKRHEA